MHVYGSIALAGETIAKAKIASRRHADELRKFFNFTNRQTGNLASPCRCLVSQMMSQRIRAIGIAVEIIEVRIAITKQYMHHRTSKCGICTRLDNQRHICLLGRAIMININMHNFGISRFSGLQGMTHDVDLSIYRVGTP